MIKRFLIFYLLVFCFPILVYSEEIKTVLIVGDSITAGYGLDVNEAFPSLLQDRIRKNNYPYKIINAGLSGETSAGGLRRINWLLREEPEILILELGANDALRGLDLDVTEDNLIKIVKLVKARYPSVVILVAGMKAPPNLGDAYTQRFFKLYENVASKTNSLLIPFILDGVAGEAELNQIDGIHPTAEGHKIIANNIWKILEPVLKVKGKN